MVVIPLSFGVLIIYLTSGYLLHVSGLVVPYHQYLIDGALCACGATIAWSIPVGGRETRERQSQVIEPDTLLRRRVRQLAWAVAIVWVILVCRLVSWLQLW